MIKQYAPSQVKQSIIKRIFWEVATKLKIASIIRLFIYKDSYLIDQGWFLSIKKAKSVGGEGQAIPWLTYPLISFIEPRLKKTMSMFEYGCGNSTIWFAERVGKIHSIEHNKEWYNEIRPNLPINAKITLNEIKSDQSYSAITFMNCSDETLYSSEISRTGQLYDVILVDGVYRSNSIIHSINSIKKNGIIIVDNVDYVESKEATDQLKESGFKQIDFWGMCPIAHHDSCTAIFYRSDNCLGI